MKKFEKEFYEMQLKNGEGRAEQAVEEIAEKLERGAKELRNRAEDIASNTDKMATTEQILEWVINDLNNIERNLRKDELARIAREISYAKGFLQGMEGAEQ